MPGTDMGGVGYHNQPPPFMGRFVGCSVGMEDKPAGGRAHGLAERLRPPTS